MINYRPMAVQGHRMAQEETQVEVTRYDGVPGVIETLAVLAMSGAAAWVGIRAGMRDKGLMQIAGYVGGIGAGLLGLLYLGERSGVSERLHLPGVKVV